MTQQKVELPWPDDPGVRGYFACLRSMVLDLKALEIIEVEGILDRYACELVDYGNGVNLDFPDDWSDLERKAAQRKA